MAQRRVSSCSARSTRRTFPVPEELKELAADAEWADYVSYNGVNYYKAEDEYGEYYIAYPIQDGAVPEKTINGLPVRDRY